LPTVGDPISIPCSPPQAKKNEVSESYARALVDLAEEKGKLEPIHADVDAMASLLKENAPLRALLANPVVENEKKRAVLVKLGKDAGFQEYTNNFMNLLLEKDRLALLDEICESFEEFYCKLTDTQVKWRGHEGRRSTRGGPWREGIGPHADRGDRAALRGRAEAQA
jgi:hypothetical protein